MDVSWFLELKEELGLFRKITLRFLWLATAEELHTFSSSGELLALILALFSILQIVGHDSANQEIRESPESPPVGFLCPVIFSAGLLDTETGVWGWNAGWNLPITEH